MVPVEREVREKICVIIGEMTLEEFSWRAGVVREEASAALAARREVKVSVGEMTVEEFLMRPGVGVMPEEAARIRQGLAERKIDRMGRNKMRVAEEQRQRRMIKNRVSAARSRELKQSMAVTVRLEEETQQQEKDKDKRGAKQIAAATSS